MMLVQYMYTVGCIINIIISSVWPFIEEAMVIYECNYNYDFTTAQQEAQRAQFVVEKAIQERQQKIVQAEGEAKAAILISLTFK